MTIKDSLLFIRQHRFNKDREKRAILNYLVWQLKSRVYKGPFSHQFTDKSKLLVEKGMRGATGNIYCGLHEFEEMAFLLHFLRQGELFVDVGANIGTYTVLAAAHVGANVYAAEPIPSSFGWLNRNIQHNKIENLVTLYNGALGRKPGELAFTNHLGAMNHVALKNDGNHIKIQVTSLDQLLSGKVPVMIKIDVEGYETEVIAGACKTLQEPGLEAVIMELNGAGYEYGFNEEKLHHQMLDAGFRPFTYDPYERRLIPLTKHGPHNTIYLRNPTSAMERIRTAPTFKVRNKTL